MHPHVKLSDRKPKKFTREVAAEQPLNRACAVNFFELVPRLNSANPFLISGHVSARLLFYSDTRFSRMVLSK